MHVNPIITVRQGQIYLRQRLMKMHQYKCCSSLSDPADWQSLLQSCSDLLSTAGGDVPEENLYKLRLTDMALDASINLGRWEEALRYGMKTLSVYRWVCVCVCVSANYGLHCISSGLRENIPCL